MRVPFGLYALLLVVAEEEFLETLPLLDVLYLDVVLPCEFTELRLFKLLLLTPLLELFEA